MQPNGTSSAASIPPAKIEPQYVRFVGDTVGVVNLTPGALQFLADQVTRYLTRAVEDAKKYSIHGRRSRVIADDLETTLKAQKLHVPMGVSSKRGPHMRQFIMPSGEELFVRDDYDVDVSTIDDPTQLPKIPLKPYIKAHWLAVDGKIAQVPENVRAPKDEHEEDRMMNRENGDGAGGAEGQAAAIAVRRETAGGAAGASVSFRSASRSVDTKELILIKAPIVESLSVEQQLYLREIVEACVGQDDVRRQGALYSLETDTGLMAVLPKLSRMVHHAVRYNVIHRCLSMLIYVVRMVRSISLNQSVQLEGVLHELIPSLLSCMIGRQLCARPETDNHWALRDFASKTLTQLVKDHGVFDTRDRALRAVRRVWDDPKSTYPTIYGCLLPMAEFSNQHERVEMGLRVQELMRETSPVNMSGMSPLERVEAQKLHQQLMKTEGALRKWLPPGSL